MTPIDAPEVLEDRWHTPNGNPARFLIRAETSDWNTVNAITAGDEYGLAGRPPILGLIVDVGAHIGAFLVAALLDNPDAFGIAVEALPENVDLIRRNLAANGLEERAHVYAGGATNVLEPVRVAYGQVGDEFENAHRYIGGLGNGGPSILVRPITLERVLSERGEADLVKIDCEGCEWAFLDTPAVAQVREFVGEIHPRLGNGTARLFELLEATHDVTTTAVDGFGPFRAIRRAQA